MGNRFLDATGEHFMRHLMTLDPPYRLAVATAMSREMNEVITNCIAEMKIPPVARWKSLSRREWQIVTFLVTGKTRGQTAKTIGISPHTLDCHMITAYRKLNVHNVVELTRLYVEEAHEEQETKAGR